MDLVDSGIERYAESHTSPWPPEIAAIDRSTRQQLGHESMLSGPVVGRLLETLAWVIDPDLVLEVGTFSGASALFLAGGLRPDARLITCEADPEHAAFARAALAHEPRVELREGPALATIAEIDEPIDLAFIDADKAGYPDYLEAILPRLSPRGLIVADNVLRDGRVLDPEPGSADPGTQAVIEFNRRVSSNPSLTAVLLTVRDGVTLIRKRGA